MVVGGILLFVGKMESITMQREAMHPLLSQFCRKQKLIQHLKPQGYNFITMFLGCLPHQINSNYEKCNDRKKSLISFPIYLIIKSKARHKEK